VGHRGAVTSLAPYTYLPCVISGALDGSIRVWNLETLDQVEKYVCLYNLPCRCIEIIEVQKNSRFHESLSLKLIPCELDFSSISCFHKKILLSVNSSNLNFF